MLQEAGSSARLQIDAPRARLLNSWGSGPVLFLGLAILSMLILPETAKFSPLALVAIVLFGVGSLALGTYSLGSFLNSPLPSFAKGQLTLEENRIFADLIWFGAWRYRCELLGDLRLDILAIQGGANSLSYRLVLCEDRPAGLVFWLEPFSESEAARLATVLHQKISGLRT